MCVDLSPQLLHLKWLVARLQHLQSRFLRLNLSLVLPNYCLLVLDPPPVFFSYRLRVLGLEGGDPVCLFGLADGRYFYLSAFLFHLFGSAAVVAH